MTELIKDKYLKSKFEHYKNLSTEVDEQDYWDKTKVEYDVMSETEKETIREAFKDNLAAINNKLQEIDKEIKSY